jgi:uncharacterized cupin superfamily protein
MPKIDLTTAPQAKGSTYPAPFDEPCKERASLRLGIAAGLTQFGVNLVTMPSGCWSSQRHWHAREDEFVWMIEGELVLVEDEGETLLHAGDSAGFKAGSPNGHHLVNRSGREAVFLAIGTRDDADHGDYPDIDMRFTPGRYSGGGGFTRKDGTRY